MFIYGSIDTISGGLCANNNFIDIFNKFINTRYVI